VDWLLCDVIAEPEHSAGLLLEWLRRAECRRFVVTLKLKGGFGLETLASLRAEMPNYTTDWRLQKLCSNKKEICVFGFARE
jgi:23S rRNA (cytidine2498-2'-O)-methyltransferase